MASPRNVTLEDLLAQAGWVQALARSLVHNPDDASDVAQDAWVSALTKPPSHGGNLRAWFARVVRRRRADARRSEARRAAREDRASPGPIAPSAEDLLCRAECRARIAQEVLRLEEPYRGTILLKYFEGVPAVEIARLQGVPDATVRTRLRRAIGDLRTRLGERGDARLVVAPLLGGGVEWSTQLGSEVLVAASKAKLVTVSCVALALAGGTAWLVVDGPTGPESEGHTSESLVERDAPTEGPSLVGADRPPSVETGDSALAQEGVRWDLHERDRVGAGIVAGVVTDERGRPRAGVSAILLEHGDETRRKYVATDADGRFSFAGVAEGSHTLWLRWGRAELSRRVKAGAASLEVSLLHDPPFPDGVRIARAAPEGVLGGTVVDSDGAPVAGGEVQLFDETGRTRLETATTDAVGEFRFEALDPGQFGLHFQAPGAAGVFTYARVGQWLHVALRTPARIVGIVVEAGTEQPLAGIPVAAHPATGTVQAAAPAPVRTGADGSFVLVVADGSWRLGVGRKPGLLDAAAPAAAFRYQEVEAVPRVGLRIALVRGAVIEGELRGPDGTPWLGGAAVYAFPLKSDGTLDYASGHRGIRAGADGTFRIVGLAETPHDISVTNLETPTAQTPAVFGLERRIPAGTSRLVVPLRYGRTVVVRLTDPAGERLSVKGGWVQVRPSGTAAGGPDSADARPREDGLYESAPVDPAQTYVVLAGGFTGYTVAESPEVRVDDPDIVVRFDGAALSGRLLTNTGEPVPRAQVQAWAVGSTRPVHAAGETDGDGRFLIPGAPRGQVKVLVSTGGRSHQLGEFTTPASHVELRLP